MKEAGTRCELVVQQEATTKRQMDNEEDLKLQVMIEETRFAELDSCASQLLGLAFEAEQLKMRSLVAFENVSDFEDFELWVRQMLAFAVEPFAILSSLQL